MVQLLAIGRLKLRLAQVELLQELQPILDPGTEETLVVRETGLESIQVLIQEHQQEPGVERLQEILALGQAVTLALGQEETQVLGVQETQELQAHGGLDLPQVIQDQLVQLQHLAVIQEIQEHGQLGQQQALLRE